MILSDPIATQNTEYKDGKLRPCLDSSSEVPLREALYSGQSLESFYRQAILNKPQHHDMHTSLITGSQRGMSQIGG
jgi:molybdenum cofactor biosynthesis enzyme MoaA